MTPKEREAYQLRRAKANADLMKIEIPRTLPGGEITPHFWYVVYEANLLKPKILNKSFVTRDFAKAYVDVNLKGKRYNILNGEDLIGYGFQKAKKPIKSLTGENSKMSGINYAFDLELSFQRRKTLRTMYRRNLRRTLLKILTDGQG